MDKKTILIIVMAFLLGASSIFIWQNNFRNQTQDKLNTTNNTTNILTPTLSITTPTNKSVISVAIKPTSSIIKKISVIPSLTPQPFSNWTLYTNNTDKYKFLYDPAWHLATHTQSVSVQGDVSQKGWPTVIISKTTIDAQNINDLKSKVDNLFNTSTTITSISSSIPVVLLENQASPQSYASKNYYFIHNSKTFAINLNDTGHTQSDQIYQHFLDNFQLY